MEYRMTAWYQFFKAVLALAFLAYGAGQVLSGIGKGIGLDGIITLAWGIVAIILGYVFATTTIISIAVSGKQATFTNLLVRKETVTISQMLIGESYLSQGFVSLRINAGKGAKNLEIMFFRDWKNMVLELEEETGVPIPNKKGYLKY
ncbi:MAG: hypothetical protein V1861_06330 [Candidatus Micrarchaeota archaeon]